MILALLLAGTTHVCGLLHQGGGKIPFQKDFDLALKAAKDQNKPVLLYFWADWSKHCVDLDSGAFSDDEVVKAAGAFVPLIVDTAKDAQKLRERYQVRFVPTLLFVDADGRLLGAHKDTWEKERVLDSFRLEARRHGAAFWSESTAKALEQGKKERRLVVVWAASGERTLEPKEIEQRLRKALGDFAWKFVYAKDGTSDEGDLFLVLNPDAEKSAAKPLAKIPADTPPGRLKRKLEEIRHAWKQPK